MTTAGLDQIGALWSSKVAVLPAFAPSGLVDRPLERSYKCRNGAAGIKFIARGPCLGGARERAVLRRVENVSVSHNAGLFTKKGPITVHVSGRSYQTFAKVHHDDYQRMLNWTVKYPVCFGHIGERSYWLFLNRWHWDNDGLSADQIYALLVTRDQRTQQRINRAQTIVAMQQQPIPTVRGVVPDDVKQFVWTRDRGRCRQCGSNVELQFDHIIPVAYGGASTVDNLQVLCGPCNRRRGASVV